MTKEQFIKFWLGDRDLDKFWLINETLKSIKGKGVDVDELKSKYADCFKAISGSDASAKVKAIYQINKLEVFYRKSLFYWATKYKIEYTIERFVPFF